MNSLEALLLYLRKDRSKTWSSRMNWPCLFQGTVRCSDRMINFDFLCLRIGHPLFVPFISNQDRKPMWTKPSWHITICPGSISQRYIPNYLLIQCQKSVLRQPYQSLLIILINEAVFTASHCTQSNWFVQHEWTARICQAPKLHPSTFTPRRPSER